jgi:hypothetical protein
MNKRLKLYDDILMISISKKDKIKFRKLAFKNNKTMSDFNRYLIKFAILVDELDSNALSRDNFILETDKILSMLGRDK